jgi:transcriptional regulator with XRE-family HTH domain
MSARHHLRAWRKHRGLSQAQLAALISVNRSYLSKVETGARRYDQRLLEAAAVALGCTLGALLDLAPPTTPEPLEG